MKKILLFFSLLLIAILSFYSCEQSQLDLTDLDVSNVAETIPLEKMTINTPKKIRYCGIESFSIAEKEEHHNGHHDGHHYKTHHGHHNSDCQDCQNNDPNYVEIGNDDKNLYITIYSEQGFNQIIDTTNIKIDIVTQLPAESAEADVENFPYSYTAGPDEKSVTFQIPYKDLEERLGIDFGMDEGEECSPLKLFPLIHVDVNGEKAWGGCKHSDKVKDNGHHQTHHKDWDSWIYSEYYTQCCECWCGFGNDYQSPEKEACLSMMYEDTKYIFWSNKFDFKEFYDTKYPVSLLVNPTMCAPQDKKGTLVDKLAKEVGTVYLTSYFDKKDGKAYVDITYNMFEKYQGYNIQLDLYIGADRIPKYDLDSKKILTDDMHMLYQHKLTPGETSYTFKKIPWLAKDESGATYIALHSAIGDCPMPSLQNPM